MKQLADALLKAGKVSEEKVKELSKTEMEANNTTLELKKFHTKYWDLLQAMSSVEQMGTYFFQDSQYLPLLFEFGKAFANDREVQKQANWHHKNIMRKQSWQIEAYADTSVSFFGFKNEKFEKKLMDQMETKWKIRALGYTLIDVIGEKSDQFSLGLSKAVLAFLQRFEGNRLG